MCVHAREIVYVHASMCMFTLLHACVCIGGGMLSNIVCMCFDVHAHGTHDIVPFLGVPCMYVYTFTHVRLYVLTVYKCPAVHVYDGNISKDVGHLPVT